MHKLFGLNLVVLVVVVAVVVAVVVVSGFPVVVLVVVVLLRVSSSRCLKLNKPVQQVCTIYFFNYYTLF